MSHSESTLAFRIFQLILFVGPATSIAVSPFFNYDPINLIKNLIVASIGFYIAGLVLANKTFVNARIPRWLRITLMVFVLSLLINLVFAPSPWYQKFWGVFGRSNGILSYIALTFIFLAAVLIQDSLKYQKLILSLPMTSIPVVLYCIIQILNLDPIAWSFSAPFATFGNVNFLSAFLGLSTLVLFIYCVSGALSKGKMLLASLHIIVSTTVIILTESIQGLGVILSGVVTWLVVKSLSFNVTKKLLILLPTSSITTLAILAIFGFGPLARFIFQDSIVFRFDYMIAAFKTFIQFPIFGVGMDSFGDWYRANRGIVSAFRTGTSRTTNSAHNVFLDLAAGGGLLVILPYLTLMILILIMAMKYITKHKDQSPTFTALFVSFIGYNAQALISINQVSVGVWGWIISGGLLGYIISNSDQKKSENSFSKDKSKLKHQKNATLDPKSALAGAVALLIGFLLSFLPLKTDIDFRAASNRGDLNSMMRIIKLSSSPATLLSEVQSRAFRAGYLDHSATINKILNERFPRDFGGWLNRFSNPNASAEDQQTSLEKISELDPYFLCFQPNASAETMNLLKSLPPKQQREISGFWKLINGDRKVNEVTFDQLPPDALAAKILSNCQ